MGLPTTTLTDAANKSVTFLTTQGFNQVPYLEHLGYEETLAADEQTATRIVSCRWQDRQELCEDFCGFASWAPGAQVGGTTTNMTRQVPEEHPDRLGLFAVSCELIEGFGVPPADTSDLAKVLTSLVKYGDKTAAMRDPVSGMCKFALARYRIRYEALTYSVYSDAETPADNSAGELGRFVDRDVQFSADGLSVQGRGWFWVPGGVNNTINEPPTRILGLRKLVYTWKMAPFKHIPWTIINAAIGRVNRLPFDPDGPNYAPGTALFDGIEIKRKVNIVGILCADVAFGFSVRNNGALANGAAKGWNFIYKPSAYDFVEASDDGTAYWSAAGTYVPPGDGRSLYNNYDLNTLFALSST